jgi:hypothetical protein
MCIERPILSGRLGKWAYSLVEYDLEYEALGAMKGQELADSVVGHQMEADANTCVKGGTWKRFFNGSVCSHGQGIGCFIISPSGAEYEMSTRLEFKCPTTRLSMRLC